MELQGNTKAIGEAEVSATIRAGQHLKISEWVCEVDIDNAFALIVGAILSGKPLHLVELNIENLKTSLQPDSCFVNALNAMGVEFYINEKGFFLSQSQPKKKSQRALKPLEMNLETCPDLFPLLSLLCGMALGRSRLYGARHLAYKESHRIRKVHELLSFLNVESEVREDGLVIDGGRGFSNKAFSFDPDQDHRLAMACGILMEAGYSIELQNPACVQKSFPDFWEKIKMKTEKNVEK